MIPKYFRLGRQTDPLFAETEIKMVLLLENFVIKLVFILITYLQEQTFKHVKNSTVPC